MRYARTHKDDTRRRLLGTARTVAKRGGFATTGIDALMAELGLSGAAFYGHFASKDALFAALVDEEMARSAALLAVDAHTPADQVLRHLRGYLGMAHARQPEAGCLLPALGAEIARGSAGVRATVEAGLRRIQQGWRARGSSADDAWALLAQCVGALMLARVVHSPRTQREILGASRRFLARSHGLAGLDAPARRTAAPRRTRRAAATPHD